MASELRAVLFGDSVEKANALRDSRVSQKRGSAEIIQRYREGTPFDQRDLYGDPMKDVNAKRNYMLAA